LRVCITGASGFLGTWTSQVLSKDFDVFAITRTQSSVGRLKSNSRIRVVQEEFENWATAVNDIAPDVLIMHDWQGVGNLDRNSQSQYSNVDRAKIFVKSLKPIKQVIGVGSQAELGPRESEIFDEDLSNPTTEYGRAKCETRDFLVNHFQDKDTNFKWARIFSTYGAMDNGDWLIPSLVKSLKLGTPFPLTEGTQEWNYLHAFDAAEAFRILSLAGDSGIYNIGHTETSLIRDVCSEIASIMGKDQELLQFGAIPMRSDQVFKLQVSTSKLQSIGWRPRVNLSQGLTHTINWLSNQQISPMELNDGTRVDFAKFFN
jgi:nucleoside-diphosphate-sugar epimerase